MFTVVLRRVLHTGVRHMHRLQATLCSTGMKNAFRGVWGTVLSNAMEKGSQGDIIQGSQMTNFGHFIKGMGIH